MPRDPRLDLIRGLANWAIFVDHVPHELLSWATLKHYGFSDAADCFVFIAGFTAATAFGKVAAEQGQVAAFARAMRRAFQLYTAHILTLLVFVALVALTAHGLHDIDDLHQYNVDVFTDAPVTGALQALLMQYKPVNLDVLPLYVLLIGGFAPVLPLLRRAPHAVLALSFLAYDVARCWQLNLPAWPHSEWYFNPMAWQFLFVLGAWFAVTGRRLPNSNTACALALAYLLFALFVAVPNDKTNLAPCRILHLLALIVLLVRLLPADAAILRRKIAEPAILCGKHSLPVFCAGVVLSYLAHVIIEAGGNGIAIQLLAGAGGIGVMIGIAYACRGQAVGFASGSRAVT